MTLSILASGFHILAIGIGLGALFARGLHFRGLKRPGSNLKEELSSALLADNFWGVAALLWIATGLWRAFGGVEKEPGFYLHNGFFWVKMGLFLVVFLLELRPMIQLVRWRLQVKGRGDAFVDKAKMGPFILLNDLETALIVLIPFAAAAMARGIWMFH